MHHQPLICPVTKDEVKKALFSIDVNKSPGPDGFSSGFFREAWEIVGEEFSKAIMDFFQTGKLMKVVNSTIISLIPKTQTPDSVLDFRPISCCTTIYKTISKILTNRLSSVMGHLIGKEQAAFVGGRSLFNNTMLSQELVNGYGRKYLSPRCMIKVDIKKAFDSVNWEFLVQMLAAFGFPSVFCHWVKVCVTTPRYSLRINGGSHGYFEGKRGLRQGDPLSPLLFVLSMEVMSRMLRQLPVQPLFSYHPKCSKLGLTHLIFADDLLVFARGDVPSVMGVVRCLSEFASFSGLTPNPAKTSIYLGGVSAAIKQQILDDSHYVEGCFPFRYLGTPLNSSRLTAEMYHTLISKIKSKVLHWAAQNLSYAGKLQLLCSSIFGLENFWCSCLFLSKGIIKAIEKICRQFLWGYSDVHRKFIFMSWDKVCRSKKEGGFDIREILSWNKTLLTKWLAKLFQMDHSVWVQWIRTYHLKGVDLWSFRASATHSRGWNGLLAVRNEILHKAGGVSQAKALFQAWTRPYGKLDLHKVYGFFRNPSPPLHRARPMWDTVVMPRHSIIATLAIHNALATVDNLCTRGICLVNRCCLCCHAMETVSHLFFECPYSCSVLQQILNWIGTRRRVLSFSHELYKLYHYKGRGWRKKWARCAFAACIYYIWKERNCRVFTDSSKNVTQLVFEIKFVVSVCLYAYAKGHERRK